MSLEYCRISECSVDEGDVAGTDRGEIRNSDLAFHTEGNGIGNRGLQCETIKWEQF